MLGSYRNHDGFCQERTTLVQRNETEFKTNPVDYVMALRQDLWRFTRVPILAHQEETYGNYS
jgi:hypothetical protein